MNSRFQRRLNRADLRVQRVFAEEVPVILWVGPGARPISAIFEDPDNPVDIPGGGSIDDRSPSLSAMTPDIFGLQKGNTVLVNGEGYRVTHIGSSELGRTRVTLARGGQQERPPEINQWSKK